MFARTPLDRALAAAEEVIKKYQSIGYKYLSRNVAGTGTVYLFFERPDGERILKISQSLGRGQFAEQRLVALRGDPSVTLTKVLRRSKGEIFVEGIQTKTGGKYTVRVADHPSRTPRGIDNVNADERISDYIGDLPDLPAPKVTEADAAKIIADADMTGRVDAKALAEALNAQAAEVASVMRGTLIANLGSNPILEAVLRAESLAEIQAKGFLLDFTRTELNRMGETIAQGLREGLHSTDIARRIRDQIGLTAQGSAQVEKLRAGLLAQGLDSAAIEAQAAKMEAKLIADRAKLIARAEVNRAVSGADLANALADGRKFKAWITVGDEKVTDDCQANEAEGWIPIDDDFQSGDAHPPRAENPNCRCTIATRTDPPSEAALKSVDDRIANTEAAKAEADAMANS